MASTKYSPSSKKAKAEQSVMGTNNSSIVSKRSVERLYYPEPHFFKHFVKKPQRRAPLINRGYWLRMHAIDAVVRQFLEETSPKRKLIINLGCGYDPLAFQWLSKVKRTSRHVTFIDVDFPDLISKKSQMISSTPQICKVLGEVELLKDSEGTFLRSASYYAIGCDLADTNRLDKLLSGLIDISKYQILFTAEVSITYMDINAADSIIAWAARQNDAHFCLLEQYLPDGADHPFASKMLQHFVKLQTPLRNIGTYPGMREQVQRFSGAGWHSVHAASLWDVYRDPNRVSCEQRRTLDQLEPFDEWEEFVLFASHYFLLVAKQQSNGTRKHLSPTKLDKPMTRSKADGDWLVHSSVSTSPCPGKRFGMIVRTGVDNRDICHIGGLGPQTRTRTTNAYRVEDQLHGGVNNTDDANKRSDQVMVSFPTGCEPRMCCTNTAFGPYGSSEHDWLLVGGRKSPHHPLQDCWLLRDQRWRRVDDLPIPLFRHCSTSLILCLDYSNPTPAILVYGGKTADNVVSNGWFLWQESVGWRKLVANIQLRSVFGAAMMCDLLRGGILLGGMFDDGTICDDFYTWEIEFPDDNDDESSNDSDFHVVMEKCVLSKEESDPQALEYLSRFGATIEKISKGYLLIGGVANKIIPASYEVLKISAVVVFDTPRADPRLTWSVNPLFTDLPSPRSLLVGHSSTYTPGRLTIVGGGAVCFSFGTYWNTTPITLCSPEGPTGCDIVVFVRSSDDDEAPTEHISHSRIKKNTCIETEIIEEPSLLSAKTFKNTMSHGQPVVSRKLKLGRCLSEWQSLETVKDRVAGDQDVVVHVSDHRHLDFRQKNFKYVTKSFRSFIDDFQHRHKQYLRSLASDSPAEKPANFMTDFPELAKDFDFFDQLSSFTSDIHSSVLRISGFVDMWLHYDVMANMLCQIRGTKRLILFPPSDVSDLSLPAGSSTSSVNCFSPNFTEDAALAQTHPHHVILQPGDVLYIPPLWLHAASPIDSPSSDESPADGVSISINIFFRSLESGYAPGRDVYGNRDMQAYEKGRQDLEKMTRAFDRLPPDMRRFYLDRLADELKEKARSSQQG